MSLKKLPSQLSNEDLLAALEKKEPTTQPETEVIEYKNDIVPFLSFYGIAPGAYKVHPKIIYTLYKQWSKDPVNNIAFSLEVNKYLFVHKMNNIAYFNINLSAMKLSEKSFKLLKKQSVDKRKSPTYTRQFNNFLKHYGIKPGKTYIPFYALYYLYDKYTNNKKQIAYNVLLAFFKLYYKEKRLGSSKGVAFAVDKSILLYITHEEIEEIKKGQKYKEKKGKK